MFDKSRYPACWPELRAAVQQRAGDRCETCGAVNHLPHPRTGSRVVCTTAHIYDDDKMTLDISRLIFECQACHLRRDRPHHMAKAAETRARKRGQLALIARAS